MRVGTTLIPALHALRVHRLRTGLALLGICFGVTAVILIVAWGSIGRAKLEAEISELGADVLVVLPGAARSEGAWRATGSLRSVTESDAEAIAREAVGIAASAPLLRGSVQVVYGNHNQATTLRGVTLRVADGGDMGRATEAVRDLLRERHRLAPDSPDDFLVRDLAAVQRAQSRSALLMTLMLVAAAAVSLLVGGIGIMNLMLVSVSERRQEIGLRMAIGARRREIGLQFLIEAGLLALLGSGAGVMLALGAAVAFGAASAIGNPATSVAILAAVAAATLITLISALFPARKAARLDPADALVA